jgi:hypothetical protein
MRNSCGAWLMVMQMAVLAAVLSPAGAGAQTTATITGRVEDQSRGVLPGAAVAALHLESGLTRSTVTDADGRFTFAALPVGGYELRVQLSGFRPLVRRDVTASVNETVALTLVLEVGGIDQEVTVVASPSRVNVATPELS